MGLQVNLRERQGFIIHPFTVPISTSAAQLTLEKDGYLIEPAFDFKQRSGYLSVAKDHNKYNLRGSYAFREVRAYLKTLHTGTEMPATLRDSPYCDVTFQMRQFTGVQC